MKQLNRRLRISSNTVLLGAVLFAVVAYLPGLSGGFTFDDYNTFVFNKDVHTQTQAYTFADILQAGWSGVAGPFKRPIAMMSFALNYSTTGDFIAAFKLTNLLIHVANGILFFVLSRLLLAANGIRVGRRELDLSIVAAVAAAIWLVHPLNLTSVLYVVQRMTSLAAMFSLSAMICYCIGRQRLERGGANAWWLIGLAAPSFITLGILCKENAVLALPLIALIEVCFYQLRTYAVRDRTALIWVFGVTIILPLTIALIYLAANPDFLAARFSGRPFTLTERLLTEARVLWFYMSQLLLPQLSQLGLYHDDFQLSTSLTDPVMTGAAVTGIACAIVAAAVGLRRQPMLTFAIGWYLIGHILESSVVALELVHEHRNYLPSMGVVLALCYGAVIVFHGLVAVKLQIVVTTLSITLLAVLTFMRAGDWSDPITLAVIEAERHPNSFRAVYDLARVQSGLFTLSQDEHHYRNAMANFERSVTLNPHTKLPLAAMIQLEFLRGRVPRREWIVELRDRYKTALFHPADTADLHQMVACHARPGCNFPHDDVVDLISAALSNPTIPPYAKAQLLVDLAIFYVNEAYDLVPAMNLLDDAVALFPKQFTFRNTRAQIYLMAGRFDEVEEETRLMRLTSVWGDHLLSPVDAIEELERAAQLGRQKAEERP